MPAVDWRAKTFPTKHAPDGIRFLDMQTKPAVPFNTLLKTMMIVSSPSLLVLSLLIGLQLLQGFVLAFGYQQQAILSASATEAD